MLLSRPSVGRYNIISANIHIKIWNSGYNKNGEEILNHSINPFFGTFLHVDTL